MNLPGSVEEGGAISVHVGGSGRGAIFLVVQVEPASQFSRHSCGHSFGFWVVAPLATHGDVIAVSLEARKIGRVVSSMAWTHVTLPRGQLDPTF